MLSASIKKYINHANKHAPNTSGCGFITPDEGTKVKIIMLLVYRLIFESTNFLIIKYNAINSGIINK